MEAHGEAERRIGPVGATGVGVGAIVGGGILALAGAAFAATGPSALVAFGLNGGIALLTALSFAEVSSKFPQSGGTYTFAKRVLSVEAAFTVGWVVWFASIVAAVLYARGFAEFALAAAAEALRGLGREPPAWLGTRAAACGLAAAATLFYTAGLLWKGAGGGQWINAGKVIVFAVLIFGGLWALRGRSAAEIGGGLRPFFASGAAGLFQAMGFTFIALQGFDLIAAVAGEVREPARTIPRAMFASLGIALLIYLPLLFVIAVPGMPPGVSVTEASRENPETIIAAAAQNYLGPAGFWLVMLAAVLSMLSALQANLFAASRVALSMARDRTLPRALASLRGSRRTPAAAVVLTAVIVIAILAIVPDLAAAGAAASLIFLVTFALAHWIAILVRQRSVLNPPPFRAPLYPAVPILGGMACLALAVYQGFAVPSAGSITVLWLAAGGLLFLLLFARKARIADVSSGAFDPELLRLRGRSPLVLVPIANPESAAGLIAVAGALAPPGVGRVLALSVVVAPEGWSPGADPRPLENLQRVLGETITAAVSSGSFPETLATIAPQPWREIGRVARAHRCESLLLGLSRLEEDPAQSPLEQLLGQVDCDIVVLRAPRGWQLPDAKRILVPTRGRGGHDELLARLLGSFSRSRERETAFLAVLPEGADAGKQRAAARSLRRTAESLSSRRYEVRIACSDSPADRVAEESAQTDLLILGAQRLGRRRKFFGQFALQVARRTTTPLLLICRRG